MLCVPCTALVNETLHAYLRKKSKKGVTADTQLCYNQVSWGPGCVACEACQMLCCLCCLCCRG
jgi:hypothetical protein